MKPIVTGSGASEVSASRVLVDLSDYVRFMIRAGTVSGIQRVISAIANELSDPERVLFCVRHKRGYWHIRYEPGEKPIRTIEAYTRCRRALNVFRASATRSGMRWKAAKLAFGEWRKYRGAAVTFRSDDTFLILGAAWDRPGSLHSLRQEKTRVGFSIAVLVHDVIPYYGEDFVSYSDFSKFRAYLQWIDAVADRIFCNSNFTKQDLVRTGLVSNATNALVIPLAHELPVAEPAQDKKWQRLLSKAETPRHLLEAELSRCERNSFVLCVGTIETRKNQLMLVQAWTELARERFMPLLILAGKMGAQSDQVRIALDRDQPPVSIMENVSEGLLIELYKSCMFTVFPSRFEGWGLPVGESLWFGKACLASSATSTPEVGGPHAIYFDPRSLTDLKTKILSLLDSPESSEAVSRTQLRTWRHVADDLLGSLSVRRPKAEVGDEPVTRVAAEQAGSKSVKRFSNTTGGQAIYLGDHTALCRTVFGRKMYIDTRDISLAPHLAMDGEWEMWITEAMARLLRPGMKCADLGTNFGWYTLLMAERVGPTGHVLGADANPRMVDLCRKSMSINGYLDRTNIHNVAISATAGELTFSALDTYMGSSSLKGMGDTAAHFNDTVSKLTVSGVPLDSLVGDRPMDFLKIDCEGAEPGIVRGGSRTLANPNLQIFMEYSPSFYQPGEAADMIDTLQQAGFRFYAIETDSSFTRVSRDHLVNLSGWNEMYLKR